MRLALAATLATLTLPALAASALPERDIIEGAIDGYIRPAFGQFAEETGSLHLNVSALCDAPSADALTAARNQFKSAVTAFSRIEFIRLGPLGEGDRLERLLFWPDRKGIALRQVEKALQDKDPTAATAETLRGKSVAMQGLGALEFLLFGTYSDTLATNGEYRCNFAESAATLIGNLASELTADWHSTSPMSVESRLLDPKSEYIDFRTSTEVLEKLAATLVHGTETIRDQRLKPILGESDDKPKPRSALFWRSGMTVPALAANFAGLHEFFVAARFREAMGAENEWVANGAEFEFANAARAAAVITDPMEQAVTDPKQLQGLEYMVVLTGSLDVLLGQNLAAALGLSVGFSTLDGD
jgi:uncharacterized protein